MSAIESTLTASENLIPAIVCGAKKEAIQFAVEVRRELRTKDAEIAQLRDDVDRLTALYSTSQAVMKQQLERIQQLEYSLDASRQRVRELEADIAQEDSWGQ